MRETSSFMVFGLKSAKNSNKITMEYEELAKIVAPIPYRALTKEEDERIWDVARRMPWETAERLIWLSTVPAADKRVKQIKDLGYEFSPTGEYGRPEGDAGALVNILAFNPEPVGLDRFSIGYVRLWQTGGFNSEPVGLNFGAIDDASKRLNPEQVDLAIKLREDLIRAKIPFGDCIEEVEKEIIVFRMESSRCELRAEELGEIYSRLIKNKP